MRRKQKGLNHVKKQNETYNVCSLFQNSYVFSKCIPIKESHFSVLTLLLPYQERLYILQKCCPLEGKSSTGPFIGSFSYSPNCEYLLSPELVSCTLCNILQLKDSLPSAYHLLTSLNYQHQLFIFILMVRSKCLSKIFILFVQMKRNR